MKTLTLFFSEDILKSVISTFLDNIMDYQEDFLFIINAVKPSENSIFSFEGALKQYFLKHKLELLEWKLHFDGFSCNELNLLEQIENQFIFEYY